MSDDEQIKQALEQLGNKVACVDWDDKIVPNTSITEKLIRWKACFGDISPTTILEEMGRDFKDSRIIFSTQRKVWKRGQETIITIRPENTTAFRCYLSDDQSRAKIVRPSLCQAPGELRSGDIQVEGQGVGCAKKAMANFTSLVTKYYPPIQRFVGTAQERGTYTWLRFGYVPASEEEWNLLKTCMQAKLEGIQGQLSSEALQELKGYLASPDPKTAWDIADMGHPISNPTSGKQTTLGNYLLSHLKATYCLELHDTKAMERFWGYIAKIGITRDLGHTSDSIGAGV